MQISYNWLKQFIKIEKSPEETAELLTNLGLEVEGTTTYQNIKGGLKGFVVGKVVACEKHPNADRLKLTKVKLNTNDAPVQIVCGAPNVAEGQTVVVATIGTEVFMPNGESFKIKKSKIRGEESFGMLCSEVELNIGQANDGIAILPDEWEAGTPLAEKYEIYEDVIFEIGLTPNRSDAMSHWGVARDLRAALVQENSALGSLEIITPSISKFKVDKRTAKYDIAVEDNDLCQRFCGLVIDGVDVKESPKWLQNQLKAIGITPKNNIVDITNYVMHDIGQPLHAYDANKIKGNQIVVRKAKENERLVTLDGEERTLTTEDIIISDENHALGLAGVIGGKESSVTQSTTKIFLESAFFNPVSVRKSSKNHTISTDASFRFERGIDPNITSYAIRHAAVLITEIAGGEIASEIEEYYPKKWEEKSVILYFDTLNKIIGTEIPREKIIKILTSLDFKINNNSETNLGLTIPLYRTDVTREIDVIEEILRVYGFNNVPVPGKINASVAYSGEVEDYKIQKIISQHLVSLGFYEIMSNSLTTAQYTENVEEFANVDAVEILNPLSSELSIMRKSLLFGGLEAIAYNINRKNKDLKLFEFGKVYQKNKAKFIENDRLALFATGNTRQVQWNSPKAEMNFFEFKGFLTAIFERFGIEAKQKPTDKSYYSEGILFEVSNQVIAEMGVISHDILDNFDIKQAVFYAEIHRDCLIKNISKDIKFQEISKFPSVKRDLALLINQDVMYADIFEMIKGLNISMIKDIQLFDVYQGDQLPKDKKSYAISLKLQLDTHTLTDKEIDETMQKVQEELKAKFQAELR